MKNPRTSRTRGLVGWILGALGIGALSTAYVDPGSGSFLIQIIIASIVGAGLLLRAFWTQIKVLFGGKPKPADDADTDDVE